MVRSLRRLAAVVLPALVLPAAAVAGGSMQSWAQPQIELVTAHGIFTGTPAAFDGSAELTEGALASAIARLTQTPAAAVPDPSAPVAMEDLDRSLVGALGLADSAYRFRLAARAAGITPPQRFGTEVIARLLGLRLNHPARDDDLELEPQQPATRAEAAYSIAQILRFGAGDPGEPWQNDGHGAATPSSSATDASAVTDFATSGPVAQAKVLSRSFALPALTTWQRRILTTAFSFVGYPYVWGGTGDGTAGYDCSGFVWRVYKLSSYPDEGDLASVLRGRTTMQMSGEVPRSLRIGIDELEPGDVMFFGRGPHSKPKQVDHAAIYVGDGWLVQSSGDGVTLAPFDGWYRSAFAWARRPLAEAGLA